MAEKLKEDLEVQETAEKVEIEKTDEIEEEREPGIEEQLAALETEKEELKNKWLRAVAEFDNFRRRSSQEKSRWIKNANQRIVLDICDVLDNFERALSTAELESDQENYQKGIKLIYQQIENILKREGVEKIETAKQSFNPEFHEALAHIPSELDENMITATIQNGYKMNGVVIRAARVAVSNGQKPEESQPEKKKKKKKKK